MSRGIKRMKLIKEKYSKKLQTKCQDCKEILPKDNKHHWRCHKCWTEYQESRGNTANNILGV